MFRKSDADKILEALIELKLENKLLREEMAKQTAQSITNTKHIKFLVHLVKTVNPEWSKANTDIGDDESK